MAQITITIPNTKIGKVVDAFAASLGYQGNGDSDSKNAFAKKMVIEYIKQTVNSYEREQAMNIALSQLTDLSDIV